MQVQIVQNGVEAGRVGENAGQQDGGLFGGGGLSLQRGVQLLDEGGVLLLGHEEGGLEGVAALLRGDLGVLCQHLVQLPHCGVVAVIEGVGLGQLGIVKLAAQLLQVADHALVAGFGEGHAVGGLAVLRIGHGDEGDGGHGILPVLAHGFQGVAQGGDHDGGRAVIRAVDAQLQRGLDDGAQEGGAVFLGPAQLGIRAPGTHGDEAHGVDQLVGGVDGSAQHDLLALGQILVHLCLGVGGCFMQLGKQFVGGHVQLAPFCSLLASMISMRPCTRVSYCASEKLRGSA